VVIDLVLVVLVLLLKLVLPPQFSAFLDQLSSPPPPLELTRQTRHRFLSLHPYMLLHPPGLQFLSSLLQIVVCMLLVPLTFIDHLHHPPFLVV